MKMNAKKIAIKLGIAIPTCVLSLSASHAAENTALHQPKCDDSEVSKNEVVELLTTSNNIICSEDDWMVHSDSHTNTGGNHSDRHSNSSHTNNHSNANAYTSYKNVTTADGRQEKAEYCVPHSDRHTNKNPINSHTNTGNKYHTDKHVNRDSYYDCE
ncbi:MAG: hypothetical protein J6Q36_07480 [Alistipes sp.]|nr:hypothetical protein [Alistipes sp.]